MWNTRLGVFTKLDNTRKPHGEKKKENSKRGGIRAGLSFLKFPTDVLRISVSGIMRGEDLNVCWTVWLNFVDINPNENCRKMTADFEVWNIYLRVIFYDRKYGKIYTVGIIKKKKKDLQSITKWQHLLIFYVSIKNILWVKVGPFPRWDGRSRQSARCRLLFCGFALKHKQKSHITRGGHQHQPSN